MKTTIKVSFGFSEECKNVLRRLNKERIILLYFSDHPNFDKELSDALYRFENFGICNSAESSENDITLQKFYLTKVGEAFCEELFDNKTN